MCPDPIARRALKIRLIWDKQWLRSRSSRTEIETHCTLCHSGCPETLRHILLECDASTVVEARADGLQRAAAYIQEALGGQLPESEFLLGYHSLITTHPHGETLLTGLLTPSATHAVDEIRTPSRLSGGRTYQALVQHCRRFYVPMCLAIHSARAALLAAPKGGAGTRRRRPCGLASHLLPTGTLRPMTSQGTDYPGLDSALEGPALNPSPPCTRRRASRRPPARDRLRGQRTLQECWPQSPFPTHSSSSPPFLPPTPAPLPNTGSPPDPTVALANPCPLSPQLAIPHDGVPDPPSPASNAPHHLNRRRPRSSRAARRSRPCPRGLPRANHSSFSLIRF